jgi:endogenous inhibitor of DNA gyrase (YacG/DUF329 family)
MESTETTVECPECGIKFEPSFGRRTCSQRCAQLRQRKQLIALSERRKLEREARRREKGTRVCEVCETDYLPVTGNQKYCGPTCAAAGLQAAIERQRERRQKEIAAKRKEEK